MSGIGDEDDKGNIAQKVMGKAKSIVSGAVTNIDGHDKDFLRTKSRVMKNKFSRISARMDATELLTKFPAFTVVLCLVVTGFFSIESGIIDCRDGFCPFPDKEPSMNVNGDLEVYLPQDSPISALLADVQLDWTTNVMVIYVESENGNVTAVDDPKTPEVNDGVLKQIDKVENKINPNRDDGGVDNVIYVLSISTVVKEVNSSAGRVAISFGSAISEAIGDDTISEMINESVNENPDLVGNYAIPDEQDRVDRILRELPQNALDKLVRDVGRAGVAEQANYWNRAVIIIGISDELKNESGTTLSISQLIEQTQNDINQIAEDNDWESKNLTMTLTGPVPITNAVTEESFNLFWTVFPVGVILVAFGLFLFHCDLLQTGRIRFVQGIKVVIISGLPTLCSVWITMGIIGWTDYEVTMTVIIVGPIILALGVSYGLHITNRYAEAKGTPQEKMKIALSSTGRAVLLSAVTTVIGFISLVTTPMAPIQTVGYSLAMGIVVVYIMTMVMVPNLTMLLDLKKPSHPPPEIFVKAVTFPINWTKVTIAVFISLMLISSVYSREQVEENIDLLDMAPQNVEAVAKMKTYSDEFEAGQPGFLLIEEDVSASAELLSSNFQDMNDPYENLKGIEDLEEKCNTINQTTAVSIVFLMKAVAVGVNISGDSINDPIQENEIIPDEIKDVADIVFNREASGNGSFWWALSVLDQQPSGGVQEQNFLINVFYNSMTKEMREFFISENYKRSLIYIDMPFMDVQRTEAAVNMVNSFAGDGSSVDVKDDTLVGVAAVTIEVNELIVKSQWNSLGFALLFTVFTLGLVFSSAKYAILTTLPVAFTVFMQWLVMDMNDTSLSLVTVMIGSILVGVGVDFSIHIANRVRELGGSLDAIRIACASTGMSLFEAATVTALGMTCAYLIDIPAIVPFVTVIIILLVLAAISALFLLPAIYSLLVKANISLSGGSSSMARAAGLRRTLTREEDGLIDATLVMENVGEAW
ncbi:MAG: RND family transporter [Candidatus Thalassarchaeaceae archaeon]